MNFIMANSTNRMNIEPILRSVTEIMVVLCCLIVAKYTFILFCWRKPTTIYGIINSVFGFSALWIASTVFFIFQIKTMLSLFAITIFSSCFLSFWFAIIISLTIFTAISKPIFISATFMKFRNWFNLLTVRTLFSWNFRHILAL